MIERMTPALRKSRHRYNPRAVESLKLPALLSTVWRLGIASAVEEHFGHDRQRLRGCPQGRIRASVARQAPRPSLMLALAAEQPFTK